MQLESTTLRAKEQLLTELNAQETTREGSSNIIEREPIPNSPIVMLKNESHEWFGVVGKHRITDIYTDRDELKDKLERMDWDTVGNVISIIVERMMESIVDDIIKATINNVVNGTEKKV